MRPSSRKIFPGLDAKANSRLRMLWIVCGTSDGLIGVNRQFKGWLKSKGVEFTEQEVPDMGHVWPLWRQNLTDMAPSFFRPRKVASTSRWLCRRNGCRKHCNEGYRAEFITLAELASSLRALARRRGKASDRKRFDRHGTLRYH